MKPDPAPAELVPAVSVIMPILNEEHHLAAAVRAIGEQDYPGRLEIILAIGPCTDRTLEVAQVLAQQDPRVQIVENPSGRTPDALNAAVAAASNAIIVRVDGHGILSPGYIRTAVQVLHETGAANVGGIMRAQGRTPWEKAVAVAMTSPLGVGSASFHTGGVAGPAPTVYLGVFQREWLARVGGYDPHFTRAQDWEMNFRIRRAGGLVYFTPDLAVTYRPRPTMRQLARQYRDYGRWRRVVARLHAGSINPRYLAPPVALVAVAAGGLGGLVWWPLWALPLGYAGCVTAGGLFIGRHEGWPVAARVPAVLATMHGTWAWGFLTSRRDLVPSSF